MKEKIEQLISKYNNMHEHHTNKAMQAVDEETKRWNQGVTEALDKVLYDLRRVIESEQIRSSQNHR